MMLLDEILVEIGEFGAYQIWLYVLLGLTGIPTGKGVSYSVVFGHPKTH